MIRNVILLAGNDGVGKSTLAKNLAKNIECRHTYIMSFADPLREIVGKELGMEPESLKLQHVKSMIMPGMDISARQHLINTATKIRETDDAYFARNIAERILDKTAVNDITIIDDFRFPVCHNLMVKHGYNIITIGLQIEGQEYDSKKYADISNHVDRWFSRKTDGDFNMNAIIEFIGEHGW